MLSTSKANRGRRVHLMNIAEPLSPPLSLSLFRCEMYNAYACVYLCNVHVRKCIFFRFIVKLPTAMWLYLRSSYYLNVRIFSIALDSVAGVVVVVWTHFDFFSFFPPAAQNIFPHFATTRISCINQIIVVGFLNFIVVVVEIFHSMVFLLFRIFTSIRISMQ